MAVPAETAHAYVADVSRHPEWAMDQMKVDGPAGPAGVGTEFHAVGHLNGRPNPSTVRITATDPPRRFEFEAEDRSGITGHVFTFEATGSGTLVRRRIYGVKQPWTGPILFLLFRGVINRNFNGALARLRDRLEAGV